mmetsp:Transcript_26695/g.53621  ORF Transcript_26695/g.53621 Transcript_26695/m.53621 type:complete len:253 (-) Transcript_26695:93-851(-)
MPVVNQQLDAGRPYAQPYSHTPHATFAVYGRASGGSTDQPYFSCRESHEGAGGSSGWRLVGSSANLDWKTYGSTHPSLSAYFWRDFSGKAAMSTLGFIDLSRELATLFFSLRSVASFSIRTTEAAAMAISILPACSSMMSSSSLLSVFAIAMKTFEFDLDSAAASRAFRSFERFASSWRMRPASSSSRLSSVRAICLCAARRAFISAFFFFSSAASLALRAFESFAIWIRARPASSSMMSSSVCFSCDPISF